MVNKTDCREVKVCGNNLAYTYTSLPTNPNVMLT